RPGAQTHAAAVSWVGGDDLSAARPRVGSAARQDAVPPLAARPAVARPVVERSVAERDFGRAAPPVYAAAPQPSRSIGAPVLVGAGADRRILGGDDGSAAAGAYDVWSPVMPGHSSLRAEPTMFRSPELGATRAPRG